MALNEAYGQTDVMNDPGYLMTLARGHGRQARFAQERLREMQQARQFQQSQSQQAQQFASGHAQQESLRRDAMAARQQAHEENLDQRELSRRSIEEYRNSRLSQEAQAAKVQKASALERAIDSEVGDTPRKRAYIDQYNKLMEIDTSHIPADAKTPAQSALERVANQTGGATQTGQGTAPSPTSVAPSAAAAKAQTQAATQPQQQQQAPVPAPQQQQPAATGAAPDQNVNFSPGTLAPNGYPNLPNTPETSYTGMGHGSLEGSKIVGGGIETPSGGYIGGSRGTGLTLPRLETLIAPREGAANVVAREQAAVNNTPSLEPQTVTPETAGAGKTHGPDYIGLGTPTEAPVAAGKPFVGSPELFSGSGASPIVGGGTNSAGPVQSGRGEFKADYGLQPNVGPRPLDFPSGPPSYVNPSALPSGQGPQTQTAAAPIGPPMPSGLDKLSDNVKALVGNFAPKPVAPPTSAPAPQMNFSDIQEPVPPPTPGAPVPSMRPQSPNEVVVQGQMPMMPNELPPNIIPPQVQGQRPLTEEERQRRALLQ